jgi:hypothetical protein
VKFADQVTKHTETYRKRLRATAREAVQDTVDIAQKMRGEGGRMRVETGFLRASIQAAIGYMPSGPTTNDEDQNYPEGTIVAGEAVSVTLLKWDPATEHLFVGWTANYARPREYNDGFLRGAVEQWPATVEAAAKRVKAQI